MEIVDDSEKELLTKSMKSQNKYGSTGNHVTKEKYLTHVVLPTDTLQGLALKYHVTMEQIKRANKLWSSDSLTLRSKTILSIPILNDNQNQITSPLCSSSSASSSTTSPSNKQVKMPFNHQSTGHTSSLDSDVIMLDDECDANSTINESKQSKLTNGFAVVNDKNHLIDHDESAADFLIRIDCSISKTRDRVKFMQQNKLTSTHSDDNLFRLHNNHNPKLKRNSSTRSQESSSRSDQPFVMMTHGKKVASSLKRLEQTQDELFEL